MSNKDATVFIALSNDVSNTGGNALKAEGWTLENDLFLKGEDPTEKDPKKFESIYSKNINSENPVTLNRAKVIPNPGIVQFALLIKESKFWFLNFLVILQYDFFVNEQSILISFILQKRKKNTGLYTR